MLVKVSAIIFGGLAWKSSALCTRASLQEGTSVYLSALGGGKGASGISTISEGSLAYIENNQAVDISKGVLSAGIKIDFNRSIYDTTECASFTEIVAATGHAYVIGTRLSFNEGNKLVKIESNVCDTGDWLFNVKGALDNNKKEAWTSIPEAKRDTRAVIKAAGDAYVDAWADSSINPPFTKDCARLEGGSYIGNGKCKLTFPPPFNITKRSYTIDEELGAVDIFHNFPFIDASLPRNPGTQTNNLMRVEGGLIRFIHEHTVCEAKNCGR